MDINSKIGSNLTIFIWFHRAKDGMPITSDFFKLKRDGDQYSLFIDEALPEDAGVFTCTAFNPAGREEKSIQVKVRGRVITLD